MVSRRRRKSRRQDALVSLLAAHWVGRGLWRVSRGRPPWRAAKRR